MPLNVHSSLMFLADFHIHTIYSDGRLTMREVVDLYGSRGFGAIAITDHVCDDQSFLGHASRFLECSIRRTKWSDYMAHLEEESWRAWKMYKMLVIPGVEITRNSVSNHRSHHILALGVRDWIDPNGDARDICRGIRAAGGLAVAAHPVHTRRAEKQTFHLWDRRHELAEEFDAWEVASGPHLFDEVLSSGLPLLANSDLHHPRQMQSWKTVFQCAKEEAAVLDAIRTQNLSFSFYQEEQASGFAMESFARPLG